MYTLTVEPYYDTYTQCYQSIISINVLPQGPLRALVRRIKFNKLGPNYDRASCVPVRKCGLALIRQGGACCYGSGGKGYGWMSPNEIPDLFGFLTASGYTIDSSVTNMMSLGDIKMDNNRKILCFLSYKKA